MSATWSGLSSAIKTRYRLGPAVNLHTVPGESRVSPKVHPPDAYVTLDLVRSEAPRNHGPSRDRTPSKPPNPRGTVRTRRSVGQRLQDARSLTLADPSIIGQGSAPRALAFRAASGPRKRGCRRGCRGYLRRCRARPCGRHLLPTAAGQRPSNRCDRSAPERTDSPRRARALGPARRGRAGRSRARDRWVRATPLRPPPRPAS